MRSMNLTALAVGVLLVTSAGLAQAENTCCQRDGSCANFIISESGSFTEEDCIGELTPSGAIENRQGYAVEGSCNTTTGHCEQVPLNGYCVANDSCQGGLDCEPHGVDDADLLATDLCWPTNNLQDIVVMQGGPGILVPSCRCVEPPPPSQDALFEIVEAVLLLVFGLL